MPTARKSKRKVTKGNDLYDKSIEQFLELWSQLNDPSKCDKVLMNLSELLLRKLHVAFNDSSRTDDQVLAGLRASCAKYIRYREKQKNN